jgi:hypothetical protein
MKSYNWKRMLSAILATGLIILTTTVPRMASAGVTPQIASGCFVVPWNPATCPQLAPYHYTLTSTGVISLPAKAAPNWGTTVANIPTLFAYNILLNFERNPNLDAMVSGMDQFMLARLSTELYAHDASHYTPSILAYAAEKISGLNLRRLEASFGPALMASAMAYAPAATLAAYNSYSPWVNPLSETWWQSGAGAGVTDSPGQLYMYDLFLDSYTAGAGGPPNPAIKDAQRYITARVKNLVAIVAVVAAITTTVAAIFAIMDSPSAQALGNEISDYNDTILRLAYGTGSGSVIQPIIVNFPIPVTTPPPPNPTLPTLPPIEGPPDDTYDVSCIEVCLD